MTRGNTLHFEMFDPAEANEYWAVVFGSDHKVVEAFIDGKPLLEIIREIELPYRKAEGRSFPLGDYGHVSPESLYQDLMEATVENGSPRLLGVYPFCCASCGEEACWSVTFRVKEDPPFVLWHDFRHEHRKWKYDLEFRFEKESYRKALDQLKHLAELQAL